MMKFGYENEYFLRSNTTGAILEHIPSWDLPHDNYNVLVEVRSEPFENPYQTLASFNLKYTELEAAVSAYDCTLANLAEYPLTTGYRKLETAGLHIHFSHPAWPRGLLQYPLNDCIHTADMIKRLDARFKHLFEGINRHCSLWRVKQHGWEYRRLPATVDLTYVTQVLAEEFYVAPAIEVAA